MQPASNPVAWSGTVGSFVVDGKITPGADVHDLLLNVSSKNGDGALKLSIEGKVKPFTARGKFDFVAGKVNECWIRIDDVDADAVIDLDAASVAVEGSYRIPLAFSFPFALGPIPMFASLGMALELRAGLLFKDDQLKNHRQFHLHGSTGLQFRDGSIVPLGQVETSSASVEDSSVSSKFGLVFGYQADLPRIDIGVGRPDVPGLQIGKVPDGTSLRGSVYTRLGFEGVSKHLVQTKSDKRVGCLEESSNVGAFVGGELKLFSVAFSAEQEVWGVVREAPKSGDGCN